MSNTDHNIRLRAKNETGAAFKKLENDLNAMQGQLRTVTNTVLTLAGIGGFGAAIKSALDTADATAKMSDRLGIATEKMTGLKYAADLSGVSTETLNTALRGMTNAVDAANQGTAQQAIALRNLGLSAKDLINIPVDQQFERITEALAKMSNVTQRNAIAMDIFGGRATEVLQMIGDGTEGIRTAQKEAEAFGVALNRVDSAKIEMANDSMTRAKLALQGIFTTIGLKLAPFIHLVATAFGDATKEANGFKEEISTGMGYAIEAVGYLANVVQGLKVVWAGLKVVVGSVIAAIINAVAELDIVWTDTMNRLADSWIGKKIGIQTREYSAGLQELATVALNRVTEMNQEMQDILMTPLPHDAMVEHATKVIEENNRMAEAIAANRAKLNAGGQALASQQADQYMIKLNDQLVKLQESLMTEQQLLEVSYADKQLLAWEAYERDLIDYQTWSTMRQALEDQHQKSLIKIQDAALMKEYNIKKVYRKLDMESAGAFLGQVSQLMQSNSKRAFNIGKKAAIAQTLINTYQSAMGAFNAFANIPIVGPVLGAAAAAAAVALGLSQVQKIKSQQFEGGGGGSAAIPTFSANPSTGQPTGTPGGDVGPPGPLSATQPGAGAPRTIFVNIEGSGVVSQEWVRDSLIPSLNEAVGDGANIVPT